MDKIKQEITNILLEKYPAKLNNPFSNLKHLFKRIWGADGKQKRKNVTPFASEREIYDAMECTSIINLPASKKFESMHMLGLGLPDFVFIDNDYQGVLLGCYYKNGSHVVYFGKELKAMSVALYNMNGGFSNEDDYGDYE